MRITGADAAEWLHSQTTNDVKGLESGQGHHNAVLDRQGRVHGHFTLHRWVDEYWILIENAQAEGSLPKNMDQGTHPQLMNKMDRGASVLANNRRPDSTNGSPKTIALETKQNDRRSKDVI